MSTIAYVAIVLQTMFILWSLAEIKGVVDQILAEIRKSRRS